MYGLLRKSSKYCLTYLLLFFIILPLPMRKISTPFRILNKNLFRQARSRHAHTKETKIFSPRYHSVWRLPAHSRPYRLLYNGRSRPNLLGNYLPFSRRLGDEYISRRPIGLHRPPTLCKRPFANVVPVNAFFMDKYFNIYILPIVYTFVNEMQ